MKTRFNGADAGAGSRWMLVDDNQEVLNLMRFLIGRSYDGKIECFGDPAAALAAFQAAPESFAVVITDLDMPGMDGGELCDRLRVISPDTKVILVTGNEFVSGAGAIRRGFCGLLHKPFYSGALEQVLEAAGIGANLRKNPARPAVLTTA